MTISRNTAQWCEEGIALTSEFRELVGWKQKQPQDTRSGDEIVQDVLARTGIRVE